MAHFDARAAPPRDAGDFLRHVQADAAASSHVLHSSRSSVRSQPLERSTPSSAGGAPSSGWRSASELEARLKDARRTVSALELENQLLRSEGTRKSARIAQLEELVAALEDDLHALGGTVRRSLESLGHRAGQPLSADAAAELDAALEDAWAEEPAAASDHGDWVAADWVASLGTCGLIAQVWLARTAPRVAWSLGPHLHVSRRHPHLRAQALLQHVRARGQSARTEQSFVSRVGARASQRTLYELLGNTGLLEQIARRVALPVATSRRPRPHAPIGAASGLRASCHRRRDADAPESHRARCAPLTARPVRRVAAVRSGMERAG